MSADARIFLVLAMHHGHGVPANEALDAPLESAVARVRNFLGDGDRVEIRRIQLDGHIHARLSSPPGKSFEQLRPAARPFLVHDLVKCLNPFSDFLGIRFYGNC